MASQILVSYITQDRGFTRTIGLQALSGKTPERLKKLFPKLKITGFSAQPSDEEMAHVITVCKMNGWELPERFMGAPDELPPPAPMGIEQKIASLEGMDVAKTLLNETIQTEDEQEIGMSQSVATDVPEKADSETTTEVKPKGKPGRKPKAK